MESAVAQGPRPGTRPPGKSGRLRSLLAFAVAGVVVLPMTGAAQAASLSGSNFEIDTDANLVVNGEKSTSIDWLQGPDLRTGVVLKNDDPSGSSDSAFANGTKEDTIVPTLDSGGIPPNKSDLKTFGVYKETVNSKSYLHLFWTRVQDPSGTTNMDFEFNQSGATKNNPSGSPQIVPVRTAGDLLITYDLSNGGVNATISKRVWNGSVWGPATALTGAQALGTINTSPILATNSGGLGSLSARTFGEASIDLSTIFTGSECQSFGSAYLKSRSSDTFTSALKDFIPPQGVSISNCGSVLIHKKDQDGKALGGAEFTLYNDLAPVGGTRGAEDTATALKCTSATASTATLTQPLGDCTIANVPRGDYWLVETGTPAGYDPAPDTQAKIPGDEVIELTKVNVVKTGSVTITKTDDATPAANLNGAVFTLYQGTAVTSYTCTTGTAPSPAGTCTISGVPIGDYTAVETKTPVGHVKAADQPVTISASNLHVALNFVDPREFKVITIVCKVADNSLHPSSVSYNGGTAATTLGAAPDGVSAATLCGLEGATAIVQKGNHGSAIAIP